jgi:hypothetical protein
VSTDSTVLKPGDIVAGRFELERKLGEGGMGVVFLATQIQLRRKVALKLILPEHAARKGARARFEREARVASALRHPQRGRGLRLRRAPGRALHGDGAAHRRHAAQPGGSRPAAAAACARAALCPADRRRAHRRRGHRPGAPRSQARERDDRDRRGRQRARGGGGLRPGIHGRAGRHGTSHARRRGDRHARLHVPRAGPRHRGHARHGRLLAGLHALRDADVQPALPG